MNWIRASAILVLLCILRRATADRVLASGNNIFGSLGTGDYDFRLDPTDITARVVSAVGSSVLDIKKVVSGNTRAHILLQNGTVLAAGMTPWDHITKSQDVDTTRWVPLAPSADWNSSIPIENIWATSDYIIAYSKVERALYGWGTNSLGGIDPTGAAQIYTPWRLRDSGGVAPWVLPADVLDISMTQFGTFALLSTGQIYWWGYGPTAGNDVTTGPLAPQVLPGTLAPTLNMTFMCATDDYLTMYSEQTNGLYWFGKHGNGTVLYSDIGAEAPLAPDFSSLGIASLQCTSTAVLALMNNGSILVWGSASNGEAGQTLQYLPFTNATGAVAVQPNRTFVNMSASRRNSVFAIDSVGYLYGWGHASDGKVPASAWYYISRPHLLSYQMEPIVNVKTFTNTENVFIVMGNASSTPAPVATGATPRVLVLSVFLGLAIVALVFTLALK